MKQNLNLIGNLINFNKKSNSKLGNKSFIKKLEIYKTSSSPLVTGNNLKIEPLTNNNSFTFKTIQKRTKALIEELIKEFK